MSETPLTILRCDKCGRQVTDLFAEVAFTGTHDDQPPRLLLLCKKGCNRQVSSMGSHDLQIFADPETAIRYLANATVYARLSGDDWQRWIKISWAADRVATPELRKAGREQAEALDLIEG